MKNDILTAEYVKSILDYDPETGILNWKVRKDFPAWLNARRSGTIAGYINSTSGTTSPRDRGRITTCQEMDAMSEQHCAICGQTPANSTGIQTTLERGGHNA